MRREDFPFLGFDVGLRRPHYTYVLENRPAMDWFEVISENFMVAGGRPLEVLGQVHERYPIVLHGVSLSLGSTDPLNRDYLHDLARLARRFEPAWISDHLCWTGSVDTICTTSYPCPTLRKRSGTWSAVSDRCRRFSSGASSSRTFRATWN